MSRDAALELIGYIGSAEVANSLATISSSPQQNLTREATSFVTAGTSVELATARTS